MTLQSNTGDQNQIPRRLYRRVKCNSVFGHLHCTKSTVQIFSSLCKKYRFFRSLNTTFGKVGRNASEEVILEFKVYPYTNIWTGMFCRGLLIKSDLKSLDFTAIIFLHEIILI